MLPYNDPAAITKGDTTRFFCINFSLRLGFSSPLIARRGSNSGRGNIKLRRGSNSKLAILKGRGSSKILLYILMISLCVMICGNDKRHYTYYKSNILFIWIGMFYVYYRKLSLGSGKFVIWVE